MITINQIDEPGSLTAKQHTLQAGRREAIKNLAVLTGKLALSGIPIALNGLFNKTLGQDPPNTAGIRINHLLIIEYLLTEFFETAAAAGLPLLMTNNHLNTFKTIAKHDRQHIDILKTRLIPFKFPASPKPTFDFSGGSGSGNGPYKDVFTNHSTLGAVARSLKDMSVRAYLAQYNYITLGGIGNAVGIHPVECRHAAQLRSLVFFDGLGTELPWITRNHTTVPFNGLRPVYSGEENTVQDNIQIVNINGKAISIDHATEAFDEPLEMEKVNSIIDQFIASY